MHSETSLRHRHSHVFLGERHDEHARRTGAVVLLTAAMMMLEIVAGFWTGSMALLADGFHMATHAGALGLAAFAYRYARRHANDLRFTFGTGKVGELTGFASALVLALIAIGLAFESAQRLFAPQSIVYGQAILIAVLGLGVNLASARLLGGGEHGHDHHSADDHAGHAHDHHHDNNLRSAYLHVVADALTSALAIVALVAGLYLGWRWMDAAMGIVGGVVIGRWSLGLLRDTGAVLLDLAANPSLEREIREALADGDAEVTDLHVWRVGPDRYAAIISLVAGRPCSPVEYAERVRMHEELVHVTVEVHRCDGEHRPTLRAA
jgi:cation diffusion facilitator family transporter